jgi:hypothetical protein
MIHKDTVIRDVQTQIVMARSHGDGVDISISVEDCKSGCHILELRMSLEDFASAVTGAAAKANGKVYLSDRIGRKLQVKTVYVPMEGDRIYTLSAESLQSICENWVHHNHSDWSIDRVGNFNHYCYNSKDNTYKVTIRKWLGLDEVEE